MISRQDHEKRMALYNQGLSDQEIGEKLYLSYATIAYWRKINGLPSNSEHRRITPGMEVEMLRMHQDGMSDGQIAKTMGLVKNTVLSWRRRRGLRANFKRGGEPIHGGQRSSAPARGI